jgi:hypothetical protein
VETQRTYRMSRTFRGSTRKATAADHAAAVGAADQTAFERALVDSVDPRTVIELALVHRLASKLWRLRRACAIEIGLFEIQGELLSAHLQVPSRRPTQRGPRKSVRQPESQSSDT